MTTLANHPPQVALLLSPSHFSNRQILHGILRYVQSHAPWSLDVRLGRDDEPARFDEASWKFAGVVADRLQPDLVRLARRHRTPLVLLHDVGAGLPRVAARIVCDNESVARAAAEHLIGRGFTRFAYVGAHGGQKWSVERSVAFAGELARHGFSCAVYPGSGSERGGADGDSGSEPALGRWLKALEKPVAVFAAYDLRALGVLASCEGAGVAVPDEVAVLGVDNDEVLCETSAPSLSSVALTHEEAGYAAAAALEEAMSADGRRRAAVRRAARDVLRKDRRRAPLHGVRRRDRRARAPVPGARGGQRRVALRCGGPRAQPARVAPDARNALPRRDGAQPGRGNRRAARRARQDAPGAPFHEPGADRRGVRLHGREPHERGLPPPLRRPAVGLPVSVRGYAARDAASSSARKRRQRRRAASRSAMPSPKTPIQSA